ncbi:MAG: ParB/RepB/Spo0J family partition protein [Gammaproteobacteria bacterium]|nr:MAG: ParB/RepB/Spo0J family partition protein [Gammaproteobacteria bacterium]
MEDEVAELEITYLPRYQLSPNPRQPRQAFDEIALEDLAESIRAAGGIIQPLVVRKVASQRYEIVAGERRWRAAGIVDLDTLPCIVREDLTEKKALMVSLIENIQRNDLNPIEEALGLRRLIDEFGLSHQDAANAVGRSRSAVSNLLRLLDLSECVQEALAGGEIEMGHARALAGVDLEAQEILLGETKAHGWSVRETEAAVRKWKEGEGRKKARPKQPYPEAVLRKAEQRLSSALGYEVKVKAYPSGKIGITLDTLNDLDLLLPGREEEPEGD